MSRCVSVGADHAGVDLKDALTAQLRERGFDVEDRGTMGHASVDYPDFAHAVCADVTSEHSELGLLICGTGLGMSMAANRHVGIRAALCSECFSARLARMHNDANVLCLGARVVGAGLAEEIVSVFLATAFEGGRHGRRVAKIEPGMGSTDTAG